MAQDEDTEETPPPVSSGKARPGGHLANIGEDPDGPSTRITDGRRVAERIAEHEARVGHKELDEEAAIRFAKGPQRRRG